MVLGIAIITAPNGEAVVVAVAAVSAVVIAVAVDVVAMAAVVVAVTTVVVAVAVAASPLLSFVSFSPYSLATLHLFFFSILQIVHCHWGTTNLP